MSMGQILFKLFKRHGYKRSKQGLTSFNTFQGPGTNQSEHQSCSYIITEYKMISSKVFCLILLPFVISLLSGRHSLGNKVSWCFLLWAQFTFLISLSLYELSYICAKNEGNYPGYINNPLMIVCSSMYIYSKFISLKLFCIKYT